MHLASCHIVKTIIFCNLTRIFSRFVTLFCRCFPFKNVVCLTISKKNKRYVLLSAIANGQPPSHLYVHNCERQVYLVSEKNSIAQRSTE